MNIYLLRYYDHNTKRECIKIHQEFDDDNDGRKVNVDFKNIELQQEQRPL